MRLVILNLTLGGISGGYKKYLQNILPRLAADSSVESLLCISPKSLNIEALVVKTDKIRFAECRPFKPFSSSLGREVEQTLVSYSPEVVFVPTARPVRFRNVPVVTMIQNMAPLVSWKWYGLFQRVKLLVQLAETRRAVKNADKVIAISGFVKDFLMEKWGVSREKIDSIYFGAPLHTANAVRPVRLPSGWDNFVFTAGSIEPYRSLEDIINCAEYSRKSLGKPLKVVIAGTLRAGMEKYGRHLQKIAEGAGVSSDIYWAGQLSEEEMFWCYRNCSAFVMTSRVEACPNTVLEAMSCGAVCIAADNPPLPEFFAETALYYPPGDGKALGDQIGEVLSWGKEKRATISHASYERSQLFTWDSAAEKTIALFKKISVHQVDS